MPRDAPRSSRRNGTLMTSTSASKRCSRARCPPAWSSPSDRSSQHGWLVGWCEEFSEALGWGFPVECFAWPVVEFGGDFFEAGGGVAGQVGAFGEVLAEQAVGVLVA